MFLLRPFAVNAMSDVCRRRGSGSDCRRDGSVPTRMAPADVQLRGDFRHCSRPSWKQPATPGARPRGRGAACIGTSNTMVN